MHTYARLRIGGRGLWRETRWRLVGALSTRRIWTFGGFTRPSIEALHTYAVAKGKIPPCSRLSSAEDSPRPPWTLSFTDDEGPGSLKLGTKRKKMVWPSETALPGLAPGGVLSSWCRRAGDDDAQR